MAAVTAAGAAQAPIVAGHPLLGSMNDLLNDPLATYLRARRDHGDVVRFRAGPPGLRADIYAVFSAEGAQQVLATESGNFRKDNVFYGELRDSVGNGLLTSQDATYLRQRRLVQPLFTRRRVDGYAGQVADEAAGLAEAWRGIPGGGVELVGEMHRFALRVVGRILFGTDMETTFEVIERTLPLLQEYALKRGLAPVRTPRTWPTPANRRAARTQAELFALCDGIIDSRRNRKNEGTAGRRAARTSSPFSSGPGTPRTAASTPPNSASRCSSSCWPATRPPRPRWPSPCTCSPATPSSSGGYGTRPTASWADPADGRPPRRTWRRCRI
ncbi:hypothetical protein SAV31267_040440 [Streptomyces avermitilis]|uniref:Cytochrome P450 n=1 Tax=Streptomyces avermitilis TaxID=33903 RepID=A0A4D4MT43_STRAX|nr:hypothetical protein SAVMC3_58440 [Streptomyces avermitilis]GDY74559.1 hypothetical protein SAV31267_040440 [Streptomyces avermitilis]